MPATTENDDGRDGTGGLLSSFQRLLGGVRTRLLISYVVLLALAAVTSVFVVRQVLLVRLDDRVQDNLEQEVDEFERLADEGVDPATGEPLRDKPQRLFRLFLERNVPGEGEELVAIPRHGPPRYRFSERAEDHLIDDPQLLGRWKHLDEPERGELETPIGEARYITVPVREGNRTVGAFVVAIFVEGEVAEVEEAVRIVAGVATVVLLLGTAFAFLVTGRVLAPIRELRDAARSVSGTELTRRIQVRGDDELAELATTFNRMLDRLADAFASQRELVRDVSHDLRTPITIVRGHLELLAEEDPQDPAERRATVELVTDELDRMSRFVEDLSLLARAERPDFLQLETVHLDALLDELIGKMRGMADREWTVDATSLRSVVADRQRMTQALTSLADNAVKHTEDGDEIAIGARVNGSEAHLWVRDTGPGVDPRDRDEIFERFRRGGTGGKHYEGSGLGLAIVRAIAEAHGGTVEVVSEDGRGARFELTIPVEQDEPVHGPTAGPPS